MNKTMRMVAMAVMVAAVCSCRSSPPTQAELDKVEVGQPPSLDLTKREAERCLRTWAPAVPPASIAYDAVVPGFYSASADRTKRRFRFAWQLTAYAESTPYHFYFLGEKLVATAHPSRQWTGKEYRVTYTITESNGGGLAWLKAGFRPEKSSRYRSRGEGFSQ